MTQDLRVPTLTDRIRLITNELSGSDLPDTAAATGFFDLGFDSLFLTQLTTRLNKEFKQKLRMRQLTDEFPSMLALAQHLDQVLPKDQFNGAAAQPAAPAPAPVAAVAVAVAKPAVPVALPLAAFESAPVGVAPAGASALERVFSQQLQIMARQLAMLSGQPLAVASAVAAPQSEAVAQPSATPASPVVTSAPAANGTPAAAATPAPAADAPAPAAKPFGAQVRIERKDNTELTPRQQKHIDQLIQRYNEKTKSSKAYTQQHRAHLADPRTVSGFHPRLKEMIYSIVAARSQGSRIWDIDGNEFIDMLCGYGSCFFGHAAPFVVEALERQVRNGFEIGPQHHLAGEVAQMFCEMVGHERAAFCNTGSEAVLGAIRMARTVTGKNLMVMFTGDYHGINDEVIVRGTPSGRSVPAAAGIPSSHTGNVLVLDYGDPRSLEIIREKADDIACAIVEPVQSRRPELQPKEFLHALRKLCTDENIVFIVDEVICGFRSAQRGAQEIFDVQADIATYGKVVGGGMPIGVIAGKREYMDALDGGYWQFGDSSVPEVGVTYFAGTFVRHPLTLAAAKASLEYLKKEGPELQRTVNARATHLATSMNAFAKQAGVPLEFGHFTSMMKGHYSIEQTFGDLLFAHMRMRGVHIYDGRPVFLTTAHSDEDVAFVIDAFKEAIHEVQRGGFFVPAEEPAKPALASAPPVPGARLGRDQHGNPAWFVPDPGRPGKYQQLVTS
ncbi:MAG: aminotransferase class III-fold pyridoxal phosphate-dependent enzyme [Myxococcales bacterium]